MAVSQGSKALYSDVSGYYTSFNSFINNYGGSITQLSIPAENKKIETSDISNLNSKIDEFKLDEYLGSQASWWVKGDITLGDLIEPVDITGINTTITNMAQVVCRNQATNNYSNHNECCDSNNKSVCCDSNSRTVCCNSNNKSVCCNSNNKSVCCNSNNKSVCCNSNSRTVCCNTNSNHGQACTNGTYTMIVTDNKRNPVGVTACTDRYAVNGTGVLSCNVSCGRGQQYAATPNGYYVWRCTVACGYSTHGNACVNGNHGQTCANSTHNQSCSNSTHNQTCGNSTHNQTCNNSNHGQTCANSTHNQTCANSTNARTCSNTSTIDITCQQATKTNT